jgi:hypothetical protein
VAVSVTVIVFAPRVGGGVIANVADRAPAGTETVAGTDAAVELDARDTVAPPGGAAPLSVTTPLAVKAPFTVSGDAVSCTRPAGKIVKDAF